MMTEGDAVGKMPVFGNRSATTVASGLRVHRPASNKIHIGTVAESRAAGAKPRRGEMPRLLYTNNKSNSFKVHYLSGVDSGIVYEYIINILHLHRLASSDCKILNIYETSDSRGNDSDY